MELTMKTARTLFCTTLLFVLAGCPGMKDLLLQYGFAEAQPASTLFAPGTIVSVRSANPFIADIVCTQEQALGPGLRTIGSPAPDGLLTHVGKGDIPLDANYMQEIHAHVEFQII